ncbi:bile acid:sodium symporter family protein, partial [Planctobacterium marinum]
MQDSVLTQVLLPAILAVIMFGMGLSLTRADFSRLWQTPKPIFVGLVGQILLLPILAWGIAVLFNLPAELAIGLMILAACPGGTTSNVISQLARANLALSVSLTAVTTLICVFTTPWIIQFAIQQFAADQVQSFSLLNTSLGLMLLTLLPVILGIAFRARWEQRALAIEGIFRKISLLFMVALIIAIVIQEIDMLLASFDQIFWATLVLNFAAIATGVWLAKLTGLALPEKVTLGIEVGIQNASMAILIAITFLSNPAYATSAGVYGVTMYIGAV